MPTAEEIADGFSGGVSARNRARSLVAKAKREEALKLAAEVRKILEIYAADGYGEVNLGTLIESWVTVTRETAEEE
jgi:hypothetical protein